MISAQFRRNRAAFPLDDDDDKAFVRRPLDILRTELLEIVNLLPVRCVRALRTVPIWVEWHDNDDLDLSHGVIAKYYGVSGNYRIWSLAKNKNPLKANCVEIIDLKTITQHRQGNGHPDQAVILHELAHAVHIHLFGTNNVQIRQAYQQAVDRRLYEEPAGPNGETRKRYARTNDHEYFAELSCAYFDRLSYFPQTREELRKYDPAGYRVMELTWGKARQDPPATAANDPTGKSPDRSANQTQFLSDMSAFDVYVAEGRFAQHGELGYSAGNPWAVAFWSVAMNPST